jgi:hypothetical protein
MTHFKYIGFFRAAARGGRRAPRIARFVSLHAAVYNIFNVQRHLIRRATLRRFRAEAHQAGNGATAAA